MAEDKKRLKVDVEDFLRLAVAFSPAEAKTKIEETAAKIASLANALDGAMNSPNLNGIQSLLGAFDQTINFVDSLTSLPNGVVTALSTFRNLSGLLSNGCLNVESMISTLSSFLPAGISTFLQEAGSLYNTVIGAVQFLTTLDPRTIAQNVIGGFAGSILSRVLPGPVVGFLSQIFSGTPIGSLFNFGGGGILGGICNAIFGSLPSTASVKVVDCLRGGLESPDGICLTEQHQRNRCSKSQTGGGNSS